MELFLHYLTMQYLLDGIYMSIQVTCLGLLGGFLLGAILASMLISRNVWISGFARTYAVIFRGTPLILQMVFFYDALPHIGLKFTAMTAAGLALAANEAPFIAEILRSGILGVDRGQTVAGQALGMTPWVLMRRIIAPQAIRTMIPAFGNETVSALKNSSLASFVSVQELTLRSTQLASSTFDFFSIFCASGLLYLLLTSGVSIIQLITEYLLDLDKKTARQKQLKSLLNVVLGRKEVGVNVHLTAPVPFSSDFVSVPKVSQKTQALNNSNETELVVHVEKLVKQYGDTIVLNELDLKVNKSEVVVLLGPSGSGKSTLLRCINLLDQSDAGSVHIAGQWMGLQHDGRHMNPSEIALQRSRVGVGMVFQQFNLFAHLTVLENVAGPLRWVYGMEKKQSYARAMELLQRVDLADKADALPRHLSGGQQQRVAIARALAPSPSLLLLDEPTSALDPELVHEVLSVIRKLSIDDKLTMIISTHQLKFAREIADRVIFLSGGKIIESGPAEEILTTPKHPLTQRFLNIMTAD